MPTSFDVIIVGGGLAGSGLAGALAAANLGVLLIEREATFRDRIRGEAICPWGVAEINRLGLSDTLMDTGATELRTISTLENREVVRSFEWEADPLIGFSHTALQDALFQRAKASAVTILRPAKAQSVARDGKIMMVSVSDQRGNRDYRARLVVMADGKSSPGRRWTGGKSRANPAHHRFGGALLSGLNADANTLYNATTPDTTCFWFAINQHQHRLYLGLSAEQLSANRADRSLAAYLAVAVPRAPAGIFDGAEQAGPFGFFPNSPTWATSIAASGLVLIGDAAGSADPTYGQGCSLVFRDVRELRDLLLNEPDWNLATRAFAAHRASYFAVIRAANQWYSAVTSGTGPEFEARRERYERAIEADPTLGGFRLIEERGPDGLIPDEAARAHYFGEDLP